MLEEGAERADETRGRRRPGDHNGAATQRRIRDAVGQRGKHNPPGPAIPESGTRSSMRARHKPARPKRHRLVHIGRLLTLGLDLMEKADSETTTLGKFKTYQMD